MCRLFGRTEAQIVGVPVAAISPGFLPCDRFEMLHRTGQHVSYEVAYREGWDEPVVLDVSASMKRGQIQFWNKGAAIIFGYAEDEVMRHPLTMLMRKRVAGCRKDDRAERLAGKRTGVSPSAFAVNVESGRGHVFSGIIHDSTERKQAKARLTEAT